MVRAVGDVGDGTLSWLSPIGWAQKTRPSPASAVAAALSLVAAAALVAGAVRCAPAATSAPASSAPRPGPATARAAAASALGLAFRLQRGAVLGWSTGLFFSGVSIGLTGRDAESLIGDGDAFSEILGAGERRSRRPVLRDLDAHDGADRHRLRRAGRAAHAREETRAG